MIDSMMMIKMRTTFAVGDADDGDSDEIWTVAVVVGTFYYYYYYYYYYYWTQRRTLTDPSSFIRLDSFVDFKFLILKLENKKKRGKIIFFRIIFYF